MVLMDFVQFKAISSLWKGAFKLKPTAKLKYINKQAANKLNADAANIDIEQQSLIKDYYKAILLFLQKIYLKVLKKVIKVFKLKRKRSCRTYI